MEFEWDSKKEQINISKHGIDFLSALTVFEDSDCELLYDEDHSINEERFIALGRARGTGELIMVIYTVRKDKYRIISARKATKREEEEYYGSKKNN